MVHRTLVFHDDGQPGLPAPFGRVAALAAALEAAVVVARSGGRPRDGQSDGDSWERAAATAGVPVTVVMPAPGQPAEPWLVGLALYADLFVAADAGDHAFVESGELRLVERLSHQAGCPFLVLSKRSGPKQSGPEPSGAERMGRRIAIAWWPCPPAQRAVLAAMPLLERAQSVAVIVVAAERPADDAGALGRFLAGRGIAADLLPILGREDDAGPLIAGAAAGAGADLLVMGAWTRPRLDRLLVGGATRYLMGRLALPVFISH